MPSVSNARNEADGVRYVRAAAPPRHVASQGGALRGPETCVHAGEWIHLACAFWLDGISFYDTDVSPGSTARVVWRAVFMPPSV